MACKYCNGDQELYSLSDSLSLKGDFYPGTRVYIDEAVLCIDHSPDVYEPCFDEVEIQINFCPMCGATLRKE